MDKYCIARFVSDRNFQFFYVNVGSHTSHIVVVVEFICSAHIVTDNHADACARPQNKCCVGKFILKRFSDEPLVEVY